MSRRCSNSLDHARSDARDTNKPRGSVTVLAALLLPVLLGVAALVVDLGFLFLTRYELQNAADAGALAGARKLHALESGIDWDGAEERAVLVSRLNGNLGRLVTEPEARSGYWDPEVSGSVGTREVLLDVTTLVPGVTVVIRRAAGVNGGPIRPYFAGLFGISAMDVAVSSTAVVPGLGRVGAGDMFPFVLSHCLYEHFWSVDPDSFGPKLDPTTNAPYVFKLGPSLPMAPCEETGVWTTYLKDINGLSEIRALVETGNPEPLSLGDLIWVQPGARNALYQTIRDCSAEGTGLCEIATIAVVNDVSAKVFMPIEAFACLRILTAHSGNQPFISAQMSTECMPPGGGGIGTSYGAVSPPKLVQ
jgi:hypothetical protein